MRGRRFLLVGAVAVVVCLFGTESIFFSRRVVPLIWQISFMVLASLALNLVVGTMGQLSLGHCGFMAIGAYSSALLSLWCQRQGVFHAKAGIVYLLVVVVSMLFGTILSWGIGYLIGIPALRLKGDYLAILTLGFGMIVVNVINNLSFAGMEGLSLGSSSSVLYRSGLGFSNSMLCRWIWLPVVTVGAVLYVLDCFLNSPMGNNIRAICHDSIGAAACGIDVAGCKIRVFAMSAGLAGLAGGIYACSMTTLTTSTFGFANNGILSSSFLVAICVMGGLGSVGGVMVSATVMCILNYGLGQMGLNQMPGFLGVVFSYPMLVYGLLLMAFVLYVPRRKRGR